jgi:hypothetical protein
MRSRPLRANDVQVDTIRRARCRIPGCGWKGPGRDTYVEANIDREAHLTWHREARAGKSEPEPTFIGSEWAVRPPNERGEVLPEDGAR